MPESNLIFVSYANPNLAVVRKIVRFLQTAGLKTWFDKENLLGGQEWEKEIAHAIRSCSLFVVNLSSAAVDRRGVFQKEIRLALDVALTIPHNLVSVLGFKTKRLILKPLSLDDIPSYETHFIDYEVIRHLSAVMPWPYPRNGVSEFFQNVLLPPQGISRWSWGLFLNERPTEVIGCLELWRPGTPENRGFWLARKYWGRGLMTEAVKPVMNFAFKDLGFDQLVFTNAVGNQRSRRIKEKTGARLIDVRPAKFVDPSYSAHEIWELKRSDWISREPS